MIKCPQCGDRMVINDRTTKIIQHVCSTCHKERIEIRNSKDPWSWNTA